MLEQTADLELGLAPQVGDYHLTLRLTRPGDAADIRQGPFTVAIDGTQLRALSLESSAYGRALSAMIFPAPAAAAFAELRAAALSSHERLRLRLLLPAVLHHLRWETMLDPGNGRALAIDGRIVLSRYLMSDDYWPVVPRPRGMQKAIVSIAAPANAETYGLATIDGAVETARAAAALATLTMAVLGEPGGTPATWPALSDYLRVGCDLLYLLAHGALVDGRPWLYLVDAERNVATIDAALLVDLVRGLSERRPRLVVLASCESAGGGQRSALAALGPLLVQAGVPAVVAMQGRLSLGTAERLLPVFFSELLRDGCVDRALTAARLAVANQPDWWVPVLYSRLRGGHIWEDSPARPAAPTRGLTVDALQKVRDAFLMCEEFDSNRRLRSLFAAKELRSWQNGLPEADNRAERVALTISYLLEKRNREGERALALLVSALRVNVGADDALGDRLDALVRLITAEP